ncbi:MAG: type I 3-dehydroquinate dehydratase [Planctomycetaceae bacterium]|nr:type I 3-dehydroquinate dehydratase [Planctomycetaceae bacterium]
MICISVSAESVHDFLRNLEKAGSEPADAHELLLDSIQEPFDVEELVKASSRPVVAVCRSRREGGSFQGDDDTRRAILLRAAAAGAAYVEAEAVDIPHLSGKIGRTTLIAALYDFHGTPDNLIRRIKDLAELPADWVKFCVTCRRPLDSVRTLGAIQTASKPCIGMAMGDEGLVTRVLGQAYGSRMTYACIGAGYETTPGQPTARDLARVFRVNDISLDTPVYGLLGDPVAQSRGYRLHNAAFARLNLDAVYIPFRAKSAEEFLAYMPDAINLNGLSVTIPHKPAALKWATIRAESAERIGAANTLSLTEGGWRADNTDLHGVFEPIKSLTDAQGINLTNASALVLGAGGTTRAVGFALTLLGCKVTLAARNTEKAWRIASRMDWDVEELDEAHHGNWKVVANTTPVGMYPNIDATPFPASGWREGMLAFDAVHNPQQTRFLREALAAGAMTVDGVEMFLRQASEQFRLWTGQDMPRISSLT